MLLGNDHDLYEGNLKTSGNRTNCVLSFNVQGSVLNSEIFICNKEFPVRILKFCQRPFGQEIFYCI